MRRIAFINEKGGSCKTTLAVHMAAHLARKGRRVLLVDTDTQGHAAKSLGVDVRQVSRTLFHWLMDAALPVEEVLQATAVPGLQVIPSWKEMARFPLEAAALPDRGTRLKARLATVEGRFDVAIFDAPPSLGLATENALMATDEVVVPVITSYLGLDGCAEVRDTVDRLRAEAGHEALRITRVVPALYRKTRLADEVVSQLKRAFPGCVTEPLRWSVAIDEAQSHGKTVWEYAPRSTGAAMLRRIAQAIEKA